MADTNKITNATVLTVIRALAEAQESGVELMNGVTAEDITAYVDRTLEQMAKKNEKAAERRAAKSAASDELKEVVFGLVTDEPQTRDDIFAQIEGAEDLSVAKVGARLTALVKEGRVVKETVKVDKSAKMGYKLA